MILPRFGFPQMIGSDNGPYFVSQVSQSLATFLGSDWKLHCALRPLSSGQRERMNRTLKDTLTKLTLEIGMGWVVLLLFVLYRIWNSPTRWGLPHSKSSLAPNLPSVLTSRQICWQNWMTKTSLMLCKGSSGHIRKCGSSSGPL